MPSYRSTHIRVDVKLATFLRFLSTGSYQQTVGNEVLSSTCKATVCRIIAECLNFFEQHICGLWIQMVRPEEENIIKQAFFGSKGFPGIIGCVDGTHIRIKSPGDHLKHLYYNRKGYYSINAMVVRLTIKLHTYVYCTRNDLKQYICFSDLRPQHQNYVCRC